MKALRVLVALLPLIAALGVAPLASAQTQPLAADVDSGIILWEGVAQLIDQDTATSQNTYPIPLDPVDVSGLLNIYDVTSFYVVIEIQGYDPYGNTTPTISVLIKLDQSPWTVYYASSWIPVSTPLVEIPVPRNALEMAIKQQPVALVLRLSNYDTSSTAPDQLVYVKFTKVILAPPEDAQPKVIDTQPQRGEELAAPASSIPEEYMYIALGAGATAIAVIVLIALMKRW